MNGMDIEAMDVREKVAGVWKKALKAEEVNPAVDFFDAGGRSLAAINMLAELQREFRVEIDLEAFFMSPTLDATVRHIESALG